VFEEAARLRGQVRVLLHILPHLCLKDLGHPYLVCLRVVERGYEDAVAVVEEESDDRDHDQAEPEQPAGHQLHKHSSHISTNSHSRPQHTVHDQEYEPESNTSPDTYMTVDRPGVHLEAGLQAGGDHHKGVHRVAQDQVPVRLSVTPADAWCHGAHGQPEQQDRVEQRDRDPLPELLVVEHLGALGGDVEGRILLSRRGRTCSVHDSEGDWRQRGEEYVVHPDCPAFVQNLSTPKIVDSEPKLDDVEGNILVE